MNTVKNGDCNGVSFNESSVILEVRKPDSMEPNGEQL